MKNFTKYLNNIYIVFASLAILFIFMLFSAYLVINDVNNNSSAKILEKKVKGR